MRIQRVQTQINSIKFSNNIKNDAQKPNNDSENNPENKDKLGMIIGGLGALGASVLLINRPQKIASKVYEFAKDETYANKLLQSLNVKAPNADILSPILGGEKYKAIIQAFSDSPQAYTSGPSLLSKVEDGYPLDGVINRTFRISAHNHTTHSDGKLNIERFLNQAAAYADQVAKTLKDTPDAIAKDAPFTIAITDHDSIEGCKEAAKIIAQNPEKYKNLKVILGTELTVENKMLKDELNSPIQIHLVVNCIDPFDEKLNKYLDSKKQEKLKITKELFAKYKNEITKIDKNFADSISLEEAEELNPTLKHGLNYPWYFAKSYIMKKADKSLHSRLHASLDNITKQYEPKLELQPYCMDLDEVIELVKAQDYGYMTIAHPALTNVGSSLKAPEKSLESISKLMKLFKEKGGEKALAAEIHYPYFGDIANSKEWLQHIENSCNNANLLKSGGLDSHGRSIFYSNK